MSSIKSTVCNYY